MGTQTNEQHDMSDRFVGAILGGAFGDARGAAVEGWGRDEIAAEFGEVRDYQDARLGAGCYTDDTQMTLAMLRERGIVLEICPTSNLNTGVVSGWDEFRWIFDQFRRNGVRFAISTDGPEMNRTYIRDELSTLSRLGILSLAEQEQAASTSLAASFVPNVSDVPLPRREPARREIVEREEG